MEAVLISLILLLAVVVSGWIARALPIPAPLVQIGLGGAIVFATGKTIDLQPDIFFLLFLPPLLFIEGWRIPKAGLLTDWQDIAGQWHQVPAATLRQVLETFGIRARSSRQIQAALAERQHDGGVCLPPLITADRGSLVNLGKVHARRSQAALIFDGETRERAVTLEHLGGMTWLRAPRRVGYHQLRLGREQITLAVAPPKGITCRELMSDRRGWGLTAQIIADARLTP